MRTHLLLSASVLLGLVVAQQAPPKPQPGIRSLWIPYQTLSGTPVASIVSADSAASETVYVVSCSAADPQCAISPDITLTEGPAHVEYTMTNSRGHVIIGCDMAGTTSAICSDEISAEDEVMHTSRTLAADQIAYQAVQITPVSNFSAIRGTFSITEGLQPSGAANGYFVPSTGGSSDISAACFMVMAFASGLVVLFAL